MKFEFGDFYKFMVSVGIVLLGLTFLIPWLFLSQPFDLLIEITKLQTLTPLAQSVVVKRQETIQWIIGLIPWFSISCGIVGILLFISGSVLWWTRSQSVADQVSAINLELLKRQLKPATPEEIKEKADAEAESESETERPIDETQKELRQELTFDAVATENKMLKKFRACFAGTYEVLANQRLGSVIFDILLLSKTRSKPDYIIELKRVLFGFKYGWLRDNMMKLAYASELYQKDSNRNSVPLLLVIAPRNLLNKTPTSDYVKRIKNDMFGRYYNLSVAFLPSEDIDSMPCSKVTELIV